VRGYLSLGSNVGNRIAKLLDARDRLAAHPRIEVVGASSVYETEPQGEVTEQRDFLNACLAIETDLDPEELLDACKDVEAALGRETGGARHGPRPIDVDVLLLGDAEHRSKQLTVPHPELSQRRFVLVPLLEIDADLALPDGTSLGDALSGVEGQRVQRVGAL
jgi:2-amino-4-hydroxy-6-hydroxymethyldihydropteridine diphosphokinase